MKNCRMVLEIKDGQVLANVEQAGMIELAVICGALEQMIGLEAIRRGNSLDAVKDNMLDIYLAAMEKLTEQVMTERSEDDGKM